MEETDITQWIDLGSDEWKDVRHARSTKAYGIYPQGETIINEAYSIIGDSFEDVSKEFTSLLASLKIAAFSVKLKGCEVGEGDVILQDRMRVLVDLRDDGKTQLRWRGKLQRIYPGTTLIARLKEAKP